MPVTRCPAADDECTQVVEDTAAMRGMEANRMVIYRRAMDGWKRFAVERQRLRACEAAMRSLLAIRTFMDWRIQTKVGVKHFQYSWCGRH